MGWKHLLLVDVPADGVYEPLTPEICEGMIRKQGLEVGEGKKNMGKTWGKHGDDNQHGLENPGKNTSSCRWSCTRTI